MLKALRICLIAIFLAPTAHSRSLKNFSDKPDSTLSFDTGYIPAISSNRAMRNFAMEFQFLGDNGFDWLSEETFLGGGALGRLVIFTGGTVMIWGLVYSPVWVANHEMGHGAHTQAMGLKAKYAWRTGRLHDNIFTFIGDGYAHIGESAYTLSSGYTKYSPVNWDLAVSAGGMNNSMMLAESFEDEVLMGRGHVNQILHYYTSKSDPYNYAKTDEEEFATGGDVNRIISLWAARGINVTKDDIANGSATSLLASTTFYAYLWGLGRYVVNGDPTVSSFKIGNFKLPDLSYFQNRNGLSYRLRSAITNDNSHIIFGIESMYKGVSTTEISAGWRWLRSTGFGGGGGGLIQIFGCTSGGGGLRAEKGFSVGDSWLATVGAAGFTTNSLEGEREITILTNDKMGGEIYARWSLLY